MGQVHAHEREANVSALPQGRMGCYEPQGIACESGEEWAEEARTNRRRRRRPGVTYHFRIHDEKNRLWAECIELEGCVTQGRSRSELDRNMEEALNLHLEEPESSTTIFPAPSEKSYGQSVVSVKVSPVVAFSMQLRQLRVISKLTQKEAARRLGMRSLYSYQRLERRSNPSLSTIKKVKTLFPPELSRGAWSSAAPPLEGAIRIGIGNRSSPGFLQRADLVA